MYYNVCRNRRRGPGSGKKKTPNAEKILQVEKNQALPAGTRDGTKEGWLRRKKKGQIVRRTSSASPTWRADGMWTRELRRGTQREKRDRNKKEAGRFVKNLGKNQREWATKIYKKDNEHNEL